MSEKGVVCEIRSGKAIIEIEENAGCSHCGLCHRDTAGKMLMEVDATEGLRLGQVVVIEGTRSAWAGSILLFLVPVLDMVIGVILGQYVQIGGLSADASSAVFGSSFFVISFIGAYFIERRMRRDSPNGHPRIVMVYDQPGGTA